MTGIDILQRISCVILDGVVALQPEGETATTDVPIDVFRRSSLLAHSLDQEKDAAFHITVRVGFLEPWLACLDALSHKALCKQALPTLARYLQVLQVGLYTLLQL
jgi:hypothetical protein